IAVIQIKPSRFSLINITFSTELFKKVSYSYNIYLHRLKMKSILSLITTASLAATAVSAAAFFDQCFVTSGATSTEFTYSFSIHDIQSEVCDSCSTAFTTAAAANGVTILSFVCDETPVLPAIGADAVFAVLYNMSSPAAASAPFGSGAVTALAQGVDGCLPGTSFIGCPQGNASP
ncbi:hypothetical protein BX600DRAFT_519809, partial [Xylariales sp. PMI_506]